MYMYLLIVPFKLRVITQPQGQLKPLHLQHTDMMQQSRTTTITPSTTASPTLLMLLLVGQREVGPVHHQFEHQHWRSSHYVGRQTHRVKA